MPKDFLKGAADEYDVVVIGSGLAGLTSANILGRAGHRVLLLEQHYKLGGLATWFLRPGGHIFDVSLRPPPSRHFLVAYLRAKLRDIGMVFATLLLFLANTTLSTALAILQSTGTARVPALAFFVSTLGRVLGETLAFGFSVSLWRLPWRTALLASAFTAVLFELAKRLYGWYLAHFASLRGVSGDAGIGAAALFVLWVYYTAVVFLLCAV